ncbi:MAG: N-acetyltransferase family protein [Acidimicrobiia bacterium]
MRGAIEVREPSDDDFETVAGIAAECQAAWAPDEPPTPAAELAAWYRTAPPVEPQLLFLAGDAGYALVDLPSAGSNEHMGTSWSFEVRPASRRRGVGRMLLETVREALSAADRRLLVAVTRVGDEGSASFARAVGARPDLVENGNRCATAELDRPMLQSWVDDARTSAAGYSLITIDGPVPDELVDDMAAVVLAMNDAPHSANTEPASFSPEVERQSQDRWEAAGMRILTACARHERSGVLAGFTTMVASPHRPWLASPYGTGVLHAHRGRGIGRWLKAVNALRLLDDHPLVTTIETGNAATNEHMLAINHAMGFRRWVAWRSWELDL